MGVSRLFKYKFNSRGVLNRDNIMWKLFDKLIDLVDEFSYWAQAHLKEVIILAVAFVVVLVLVMAPLSVEARTGWLKGPPKATPEQARLECRYESQLARGLTSVMEAVAMSTGEVPSKGFMIGYISHFYDSKKPSESIAAANAAQVLDWIYLLMPPVDQARAVEKAYFEDCQNGFVTFEKYKKELNDKLGRENVEGNGLQELPDPTEPSKKVARSYEGIKSGAEVPNTEFY